MPSSNGSSTAACTHLMMFHGALKPRARRAIDFSVSANRSGDSSVAVRSRTRRRGAFCATSICGMRHGAGQQVVAFDDARR